MSLGTYDWLHIGHILGFVLWVAGLIAAAAMLRAHEGADAASRPGLVTAARSMALFMEIGSMLAIVIGLVMAFKGPNYPNTAFKTGGWLHVKLLVVVVGLIVPHVIIRIKIGKLRKGTRTPPLGSWVIPVVLLAAAVAITLGAHHTLLRS